MSEAIDLFDAFSTDTVAEIEGTPTPLPGCGNTKFKIARLNNPDYKRLLGSLYKKNRAVLESKGPEAEKMSNEILAEVYSRTILLGWEGAVFIQRAPTPYSQGAAKKLLLLPDFRQLVESVAGDFSTFKAKKDEEDLGN